MKLDDIASEIANLDKEIQDRLKRRNHLAGLAGQAKNNSGLPIYRQDVEQKIRNKALQSADIAFEKDVLSSVSDTLLKLSKRTQKFPFKTGAEALIAFYKMEKHVEGGWFKECYRSELSVNRKDRHYSAGTSILFLINFPDFSAFHRIQSDEVWLFHEGVPTEIHEITEEGTYKMTVLGADEHAGQTLQYTVPAGSWFASRPHYEGYTLVSCVVFPGFEYCEFEMAERKWLLDKFPAFHDIIVSLTREP
jgi:predicted cupin superfamily sugar epimerase/chorismate mutase